MPALKPTDFVGEIVWIGSVPDRAASLRSQAANSATLTFEGLRGESHSGITRPSCARVTRQHPRGTEIRNARQLSIVSNEEMAKVAAAIGLDTLDPTLLGASIVIRGIPDFTRIPPSSRLQTENGTTLVVDMENRPCTLPAREIEAAAPGHGRAFKAAAQGLRGVTACIERPGEIAVGDSIRLHIPDQPVWAHLDEARASSK